MAWSIPWNMIGVKVSGDVGGFTIYTDRFNQKVVFPKLPPEKPHTVAQARQRDRFGQAQRAWKALNDSEKLALEDCSKKLSVAATGQNLYISIALRNDQGGRDTLEHQSGIALPAIPYIE